MFKCEVVRSLDRLSLLQPEWEVLLSQSKTDTLAQRVRRRFTGRPLPLSSHNRTSDLTQDRPAAIVLGNGPTALGVIRGLGLAGVRVLQVAFKPGSERRSRYCSHSVELASPPLSTEGYLDALEACLKSHGLDRAVVIPCSDVTTAHLSQMPEARRRQFPTSLPSPDTLSALMHKGSLARLLTEHSVPHPRTWSLSTAADLERLESSDFQNAFLKPCQSQAFFSAYGIKAVTVATREDALTHWRRLSGDGHEMVLQQYVPGSPTRHYFVDGVVDRMGELKAVFTRRRLRMYPLDYGNSSYQISTSQGELHQVIRGLERLMKAVAYRGLFSAEFKQDELDGEYKLLEINCRPWWFIWFAHLCGLPLAEMAYADALEQPLPTLRTYLEGVPLVYPYYDFNACRTLRSRGELTRAEWFGSWLLAKQAIVYWRDPMPSLVNLAGGVRRYLERST